MIDTHAHLDFPNYKKDYDEVLERAAAAGVKAIICVGIDEKSSTNAVKLAESTPQLWATVGIHPHDAAKVSDNYQLHLEKLASSERVVAIGETGLDYYKNYSPRHVQQMVLRELMHLAWQVKKPLVFHCRDAYEDLLKILTEEKVENIGGVLHCFSGDKDFARQSLNLGLYISIAGPVTYPNAHRLREVVKYVPLDRILLETDSPFLAPQPQRGKRNEPACVEYIYDEVAQLKQISRLKLQNHCRQNLFHLTGIEI